MVITPTKPQRLSVRDDGSKQGSWGPLQIATPAIVGGVLLALFAIYLLWQRNPLRKRSYDYHQVRSEWVSKIERMFTPRRMRLRALHSSAPMTLDDSMRSASLRLDFRRTRQYRSGSTDSQTPLTSTNYAFDYPPNKALPDSPPPMPVVKHRTVRWWWFFGSRPQEIKSQEPGSRWRVDDPDGSSSGHGNSSHGHEEHHARYTGTLDAVHEDREETGGDVIPIGENFASVASTPMTHHFPEQARAVGGMSTVPELAVSSGARTPVPAASAMQTRSGTPLSSVSRGLPPSYDVSQSQSQTRYTSGENTVPLTRSEPPYMIIPPPVRTLGHSSPRASNLRALSTESFLATQPPMVASSIY